MRHVTLSKHSHKNSIYFIQYEHDISVNLGSSHKNTQHNHKHFIVKQQGSTVEVQIHDKSLKKTVVRSIWPSLIRIIKSTLGL